MRIKTRTLFTRGVVTKGDPSSWRMKEKKEGISKTPGSRITGNRYYYGGGGILKIHIYIYTVIEDDDQTAL